MDHDSRAGFSPTRWTLVDALKAPDDSVREEAMQALARQYWPPVYAHLRRSGQSRHDAADLTQGFFADVVVRRRLFERADSKSFRLRTFLLHALGNYLVDDHRKRSGDGVMPTISLEEIEEEELIRAHWRAEPGSDLAPDPASEYHRRWALVVLHEALARCEKSLKAAGYERHWALFEARIVTPMLSRSTPAAISALVRQLGFDSYTDAVVTLRSTRKKLMTVFIPQALAETNSSPEELKDEYEIMLSLLP